MAIQADKLAMAILVKNEIDIIELNIRFHAQLGVRHFIIMDNGSTDGTLECLKNLQLEFHIIIVENPTGVYQQSKWMTQLAKQAKAEFGVSHVIPNDADEFWLPDDGTTLPEQIDDYVSVQTIHRYNRVLTAKQIEDNAPYWQTDYFVKSPILYSGHTQINCDDISMQLVKISPKVIVKPAGLIKIKGGNHRAKHWKLWQKSNNHGITVHHFPIRSYAQFLSNIENRLNILDKPNVKMGPHYRRWVRQLKDHKLELEFSRLTPSNTQIKALESIGVIERDDRLTKIISNLLLNS